MKEILYYAAVKTKFCIDENLCFSEGLATAYSRILEERNEKIFLQGNIFISNLAKAIFEKNETLFIESCEKYADKDYFLECAKGAEELGFTFEKGNEISKDSWLNLFKIVLLLTEEYLATKCDLPKAEVFECAENNENSNDLKIIFAPENTNEEQLKKTSLQPLKSIPCSSDALCINAAFYDFLSKNFPCQNSEEELTEFLRKIFDDEVCKNLGWFYEAVTANALPTLEFIGTGYMKANEFGAYKDSKIYINHRLALDSLRNIESRFILFLTLLHEYGHFLDDVLHERIGSSDDSEDEEGKIFACRFMEYSAANLYNADFKFADLSAPNYKGEKQIFPLEISDLKFEQRRGIASILDFGEDLENGSLELPDENAIEDVEFFGFTSISNFISASHQTLTQNSVKDAKIEWTEEFRKGCMWPDFPTENPLETDMPHFIRVMITQVGVETTDIVYRSHFGEDQHWHSMCPKLPQTPTNAEVKERILSQLEKWYSEAIQCSKGGKKKDSHFAMGKLCHALQDSFALSHCWRRYIGDEKFIDEEKIEADDHGKIWTFQDYEAQDSNLHGFADSPKQNEDIRTVGYKRAGIASKEIMLRYSLSLEWNESFSSISSPKDYLEGVYQICSGRESLPSGGSHPWFAKKSSLNVSQTKEKLSIFSRAIRKRTRNFKRLKSPRTLLSAFLALLLLLSIFLLIHLK